MIRDDKLDNLIGDKILELDKIERENHQSSGKLTASMLGWALQWQVLKVIGVPQPAADQYLLRKFMRGKQVEEWVISQMDGVVKKQHKVEYRNCIGYADVVTLEMPREIKSVTSFKYKRVIAEGQADPQHALQGCFYALGLNTPKFAVDYVNTDDLRMTSFIYDTQEVAKDVDRIISEFEACIATGFVPPFEARYAWQAKIDYNNYPEWAELSPLEINAKLEQFKKGGQQNGQS